MSTILEIDNRAPIGVNSLVKRDMTEVEGFYLRCASILQCGWHTFNAQPSFMRRWNRQLGNGRFPGFGLIRVFGPRTIQVALRWPGCNKTFNSYEGALAFLEEVAVRHADDIKAICEARE